MSIEIGQKAPEIVLPHVPGEEPVKLSDYAGERNVVLLFFPLAWSSVCTKEMCTMRDDYSELEEIGAEVLGISVDSPFALQAWTKEEGFSFPLLSDFNRDVSRRYGVLYEEFHGFNGVSKRAAFVVDKDGVVRYAEVCPSAGDMPDLAAIRRTLEELA